MLIFVVRLTRAAGAAQRVFSLMDSLPDIDIDTGIVIDDESFRGEITVEAVEFTYQMRPDNKVGALSVSGAEQCKNLVCG